MYAFKIFREKVSPNDVNETYNFGCIIYFKK